MPISWEEISTSLNSEQMGLVVKCKRDFDLTPKELTLLFFFTNCADPIWHSITDNVNTNMRESGVNLDNHEPWKNLIEEGKYYLIISDARQFSSHGEIEISDRGATLEEIALPMSAPEVEELPSWKKRLHAKFLGFNFDHQTRLFSLKFDFEWQKLSNILEENTIRFTERIGIPFQNIESQFLPEMRHLRVNENFTLTVGPPSLSTVLCR
nr:hypothetical protein [Morchella crassipes]